MKVKKYENVNEIIEDYYKTRLEYYKKRRLYLIDNLERALVLLSNKVRFINCNLDGTIDMRKKKNSEINELLTKMKFSMKDSDYEYLIGMPMKMVSTENVERLINEKDKKENELNSIKSMTEKQMWLNELVQLKTAYNEFT